MFQSNWYILSLTALFPLVIGYLWYHPKVFGGKLAKQTGVESDKIGVASNLKQVLFLYGFGLLLSYMMLVLSVHQVAPHLLFFLEPDMADPNFAGHAFLKNFLAEWGDRHRSFGHGLIHGAEAGLFWSLALLGTTAIAEGRTLKKAWVHIGFWVLTCALMGGTLGACFAFT